MSQMPVQPGFLSLGQATSRAVAQRSAARGRLQGTLLVHGPVGSGKGAFVDDLLALLFCDANPDRRPCNACRGCREARARTHPDLVIGSPERWREGRATGESIVSAARSWLAQTAGAPIAGERRVVLVEGIDRANEQTQNALLKALEEPTGRHMFVLVADEPTRVLATIRSRSQWLRVGAVPRAELVAWLVDRERLPVDQAEDLARIAAGMPGTAIGYARSPQSVDWRRRTQRELLGLIARGRADRFGSVRDLIDEAARLGTSPPADGDEETQADAEGARSTSASQREAALLIVGAWLDLSRDLLVSGAGRPRIATAATLLPNLEAVAHRIGWRATRDFIALLERIREGLRQNAAPRLALEVAMLAWPSRAVNVGQSAEVERLSATVIGRVQGVGFRWWVRTCADRMSLTGWVMNHPDERSVELVAEGPRAALDELEQLLRRGPPGSLVDRVDATRSPASGAYGRFQITRP